MEKETNERAGHMIVSEYRHPWTSATSKKLRLCYRPLKVGIGRRRGGWREAEGVGLNPLNFIQLIQKAPGVIKV